MRLALVFVLLGGCGPTVYLGTLPEAISDMAGPPVVDLAYVDLVSFDLADAGSPPPDADASLPDMDLGADLGPPDLAHP